MSDERKLLRALPARSVDDLLAELAAAQVRVARGEPLTPPIVTLHLAHGVQATGQLIDMLSDPRRGTTLLMHLSGPGRHERAADVIYVKADQVMALTVHGAVGHLALLSAGQVTEPPGPPPSRLEVRRALERHRAQLNRHLGLELGWSCDVEHLAAAQLAGVVELSEAIAAALASATRDELGLAAVKARLKAVSLQPGPTTR